MKAIGSAAEYALELFLGGLGGVALGFLGLGFGVGFGLGAGLVGATAGVVGLGAGAGGGGLGFGLGPGARLGGLRFCGVDRRGGNLVAEAGAAEQLLRAGLELGLDRLAGGAAGEGEGVDL